MPQQMPCCENETAQFCYDGSLYPTIGPEGDFDYLRVPVRNYTSDDGEIEVLQNELFINSCPYTQSQVAPYLDTCKYYIQSNTQFLTDFYRRMAFTAVLRGDTCGVEPNPFTPEQVPNPWDDLRLASFGTCILDLEGTQLGFCMLFTRTKAYAVYQRLRLMNGDVSYATATFAIPVGDYVANTEATVTFVTDSRSRSVAWWLNGLEVYRADKLGTYVSDQFMQINNRGGQQEVDFMPSVKFGVGTFNQLSSYPPCSQTELTPDGGSICIYPADEKALVWTNAPLLEYNVRSDVETTPAEYDRPNDDVSFRLWGEGSQMYLRSMTVSTCSDV